MKDQLYQFKCKPSRAIKAIDTIRLYEEGKLPEWLKPYKDAGKIRWNVGGNEIFVWSDMGGCLLSTEVGGWIVEIPECGPYPSSIAPYSDSLFNERLEPVTESVLPYSQGVNKETGS